MKAIWKNQVIADSNDTIVIGNDHYFPELSVNYDFLKPSDTHTNSPGKGEASYYTIELNGEQNKDAAWFYKDPEQAAGQIKNYVAFRKDVQITGEQ